jgi:uncharacterized membrane protein YozB (DUF420 family)
MDQALPHHTSVAAKVAERRFYFWSACACLIIASLGFIPTYWFRLAAGDLRVHPVVHVHAIALYAWLALHAYQAWLISRGSLARHRAIGLVGIAVATIAAVTFLLVGLHSGLRSEAAGYGAEMRAFLIVTLAGAATFSVLFALAIANVQRPDAHKRLMLAASVSLLGAPIARWFLVFLAPTGATGASGVAAPPPVIFSVPPALIGDLILAAAIVFDWRTRGKPHPALVWATAGVVGVHVLSVPISATPAWDQLVRGFLALAG